MDAKKILQITMLATSLLATTAQAAVSIAPSRVEAIVPPGKGFEEKFIVTNTSAEPVVVLVQWSDRSVNALDPNWLQIETDSITLAPNETKNINYTVSIPEGASGEYNAWFSIAEDKSAGTVMGANIALRTSIPIYVAVRGTEKFKFSVDDIAVRNNDNATLMLRLKNTGNVHIRPSGTIKVSNTASGKSFDVPFNDEQWGIVANRSHDYVTTISSDETPLPDGGYTAQINIQAGYEDNIYEFAQNIEFTVDQNTCELIKGLSETE